MPRTCPSMRRRRVSALCLRAGSTPWAWRGLVMRGSIPHGGIDLLDSLWLPRISAMDPQELFLSNLDAIDRAIASVCHRNHLSPQDGEEFNSEVKTKLIEANYAVLRKFEGR